jgi:peptidoglycan/LPS O-acetylase OafA/YrhL
VAAFFAVDVYFFLGGFLVAYSFLREKSKNPLKYPIAIVHRVLRFWPSYLMAILILYAVFLQLGHGMFWFQNEATDQIENCAQIWKPMFFVDNLVDNGEKMCMGWGWYLQNDMQIFIFSMIFLFMYSKNAKAAKISLIVLSVLSLILNFT